MLDMDDESIKLDVLTQDNFCLELKRIRVKIGVGTGVIFSRSDSYFALFECA